MARDYQRAKPSDDKAVLADRKPLADDWRAAVSAAARPAPTVEYSSVYA